MFYLLDVDMQLVSSSLSKALLHYTINVSNYIITTKNNGSFLRKSFVLNN